ncbi:MAG: transposase [Dehalococcoidia bacterium]|jgi:REP element-mobilizing transposase RayT
MKQIHDMKKLTAMPSETGYPMYRRRSLRLKEYDYSQSGAYFVTVCALNKKCLFGHVRNAEMVLNDAGRIVAEEWMKSADIRDEIEMDAFVVMPNHIHGIIVITDRCAEIRPCVIDRRGDRPVAPTTGPATRGPKPKSVGSFIGGFKPIVTKRVNELHNTPGQKLWQRNYYEHVIRDEDDLNRIRRYICDNPARWAEDENNPEQMKCPPPAGVAARRSDLLQLELKAGPTPRLSSAGCNRYAR